MPGRVLCALQFFPRGGSAHVARALAAGLADHGWEVTVLSGSRGDLEGHGDAHRFYAGLDVRGVDFAPALAAPDPMDPPGDAAPMHPSYEDRPGAPDRVCAALDDAAFERQVAAWGAALLDAGVEDADVLHLHHLTPIHEAAARLVPATPVVGHLHGTELLMLEAIAAGPAPGWSHAAAWLERMRRWAQRCTAIVVISPGQVARATGLLGIDPGRCVHVPNGFDPAVMRRLEVDRAAHWRRWLVEEPRGWAPGEGAGSVRYRPGELDALLRGPALLAVGRFTAVKRLPLLVEAFALARRVAPGALVLLGGHPGEWEGEHPLEAIERTRAPNVFLAGWHEHDSLAAFLSAADAQVLASVREQFGAVLVEGMACALPAVAVNRFGPAEIVQDGVTGWLVEPDDREGLAAALVEVLRDPAARTRRGAAARETARARYGWPALTGRLAGVLEDAAERAPA
ncbi:MAG TPA: glycosyltransferase family 4 protein [Solirubrobacteraceae bacterium]|nr:glycosyltransferase family 4 protein [Solirubrobacteraceae bacterium]